MRVNDGAEPGALAFGSSADCPISGVGEDAKPVLLLQADPDLSQLYSSFLAAISSLNDFSRSFPVVPPTQPALSPGLLWQVSITQPT